jgi:hypothetical protein
MFRLTHHLGHTNPIMANYIPMSSLTSGARVRHGGLLRVIGASIGFCLTINRNQCTLAQAPSILGCYVQRCVPVGSTSLDISPFESLVVSHVS